MPVSMALAPVIYTECGDLPAIVQQHRQAEGFRRRHGFHRADGMLPHVPKMMGRALVEAIHRRKGREKREDHVAVRAKDIPCASPAQELGQLHVDALRRYVGQGVLQFVNGLVRVGVDGKAVYRGEPHSPHDAQGILAKALAGVAHAADQPRRQILLAPKGIHHAGFLAPGHRVDREIPAGQVLAHVCDEDHLVRVAVVGVLAVHAEGGHLIGLMVVHDRQRAVLQARLNDVAVRKHPLHLMRERVGTHVPVLGRNAQQRVADAPAHHIGLITRIMQPFQHESCALGQFKHGSRSFLVRVPLLYMMCGPICKPSFRALLCILHNFRMYFSLPNFPFLPRNFCANTCNFRGMVVQYTSWFLPQRWAAACVCESTHVPQEGSSLLKKPAKSSAASLHPSNTCRRAAPLIACFHQASAPRVRTKVASLWSGLLQTA